MGRGLWAVGYGLMLMVMGCTASPEAPLARYAFSHPQMGTEFRIVLYAPDSALAGRAAAAAFRRIDTLNQRLSDYLSDSELNRLSATAGTGQAVPVSDDLWMVLQAAQPLAEQAEGAFDVTVGPMTRLWRWARRRNQLPPPDELAEARQAVGFRHLRLDSLAQTVELRQPGMRLDLGGIAKGYAVDEALAMLGTYGLTRALVDGGGDLVVGAPPPDAEGWPIEVSGVDGAGEVVPEARLLAEAAIATSGDTYRFVEVDGVRYSHLLDPHTGMGLTHRSLVVVIAPTGMEADALASAVSVLGVERGEGLVAGRPGVSVRVIERTEDGHRVAQSPDFETRFAPASDE